MFGNFYMAENNMSCCSTKGSCGCKYISHLVKALSNSYVLLLKTQNIHWNITGECFRGVHLMTEEHYNNLFIAIDEIAERIRMLGEKSPATFEEFLSNASFKDKLNSKDSKEMVKELLENHKTIANDLKIAISEINETNDFATLDLLTSRLAYHEKIIWMLSATLN